MQCLSFFDNDLIFPLWVEKEAVARAQITRMVMRGPAELSSMSQPTHQASCKWFHPWHVPYSLLPSWEGVHAKTVCIRAGVLRAQWQSGCKRGLDQPKQ